MDAITTLSGTYGASKSKSLIIIWLLLFIDYQGERHSHHEPPPPPPEPPPDDPPPELPDEFDNADAEADDIVELIKPPNSDALNVPVPSYQSDNNSFHQFATSAGSLPKTPHGSCSYLSL